MRGLSAVPQTNSLDAFNFYLLGRYHWNKRTEVDIREARSYFLKSIEADPKYAPSHAGLADACILMASWGFVPASDVYPEAAAAARRAIDLDPDAAEGHASLGLIKFNYHWDWDGAEAELRKAVALNPSYATAYRWLSTVLVSTGHGAEARLLAKRAVDLDPMSVLSHMNYGHVDYFSGNFEQAADQYERVAAMESSFYRAHMWRAQALAFAGRNEEAIAEARTAVSLSNDLPMMLAYLAIALAVVGQASESRALLQRVMQGGFVPPIYIAMLHSALGDSAEAIKWLERAYDERSDWVSSIGVQPVFKRLASNERFLQLLDRLRLPRPEIG
jgi:serine/threonine-protein kinase